MSKNRHKVASNHVEKVETEEKPIDIARLLDHAERMQDQYEIWSEAVETIRNTMKLRSENASLLSEVESNRKVAEDSRKELEIATSKLGVIKKDIASRNKTIGEKIKREAELKESIDSNLAVYEKNKRREIDEAVELHRSESIKIMEELSKEVEKSKTKYEHYEKAATSAKSELKTTQERVSKILEGVSVIGT